MSSESPFTFSRSALLMAGASISPFGPPAPLPRAVGAHQVDEDAARARAEVDAQLVVVRGTEDHDRVVDDVVDLVRAISIAGPDLCIDPLHLDARVGLLKQVLLDLDLGTERSDRIRSAAAGRTREPDLVTGDDGAGRRR